MIRVSIAPSLFAAIAPLLESATGIEIAADDEAADVAIVPAHDVQGVADSRPVIAVADDGALDWAAAAIPAGVGAMLPASASAAQWIAAVRAVDAGLIVLHPDHARPRVREEAAFFEPLTPRENAVLRMLAEGQGNKMIAYGLGISEHTVKFHVASILSKLGASTRTEAVSIGVRSGLIAL